MWPGLVGAHQRYGWGMMRASTSAVVCRTSNFKLGLKYRAPGTTKRQKEKKKKKKKGKNGGERT